MVEHTVQNDLHAPGVGLMHQLRKQLVAGFQIFPVCHPADIAGGMGVVHVTFRQRLSPVPEDFSIMGIHIIIVLNVVFVIGG